jgi:hypothetical protein
LTLLPSSLKLFFENIKYGLKKIKTNNIKIKVLIISFLLLKKYSLSRKNYTIIGNIEKNFYY